MGVRARVTTRILRDWKSLPVDLDRRADLHAVEEIAHIVIVHPHTAITRGRAELGFGIRAVDVNVSFEGVRVFGFESFEPEDARLDVVLLVALLSEPAGGHTADEYLPCRCAAADFFRDAEAPGRRAV